LTGWILYLFCGNAVNGWIGRQPPGTRKESGLIDVTITPSTAISTSIALVHEVWLQTIAPNARDAGVVSAGEAADSSDGLDKASNNEGFLFSNTAFMVSGREV
jgi:hypothetical protein